MKRSQAISYFDSDEQSKGKIFTLVFKYLLTKEFFSVLSAQLADVNIYRELIRVPAQ